MESGEALVCALVGIVVTVVCALLFIGPEMLLGVMLGGAIGSFVTGLVGLILSNIIEKDRVSDD